MDYEWLETEKRKGDLFLLYRSLGWQEVLNLEPSSLNQAMNNSWFVLYVYDQDRLIGTGRVISDGVINAYICGIGVEAEYRNHGIGAGILNRMVEKCVSKKLRIQLFCEEHLKTYYETKGFSVFAIGMKSDRD